MPCVSPDRVGIDMVITKYDFGHIRIGGGSYCSDVIILPQAVRDDWRRREAHVLHVEDLDEVIAARPEVLVIGTGYYGRMQVPQATLDALQLQGIDVQMARTSEAVAEFNRLRRDSARIAAALHLTC